MAIIQRTYLNQTNNPMYFADLDLDLTLNPGSGDLALLKNDNAIRRSVRNLVLLNFNDKRFHPSVGSGVRAKLFSLASPDTGGQIQTAIETVIKNFEPRVQLQTVNVVQSPDETGYNVTITFYLLNSLTTLQTVSFFLSLVR